MALQISADRKKILDAVDTAERLGSKAKVLQSVRRKMRTTGAMVTASQLSSLNTVLKNLDEDKISVAVYSRAKVKQRFEATRERINADHDALAASRPLKPPGR